MKLFFNVSKINNRVAGIVTKVQSAVWYLTLVVALALFSFIFLLYELMGEPTVAIITLGERIDTFVAYVFLTDFILGILFNRAYKTKAEYWRFNWPDFISSIPISSEITQLLRVLRIWRAVKVLKVVLDLWSAKKQVGFYKNQSDHF
jgi:type II secretory pathway component PulF